VAEEIKIDTDQFSPAKLFKISKKLNSKTTIAIYNIQTFFIEKSESESYLWHVTIIKINSKRPFPGISWKDRVTKEEPLVPRYHVLVSDRGTHACVNNLPRVVT